MSDLAEMSGMGKMADETTVRDSSDPSNRVVGSNHASRSSTDLGKIWSMIAIVIAVMIPVVVFLIVWSQAYWTVAGSSMYPTLVDGDIVYGSKTVDSASVGDESIIVFNRPTGWSDGDSIRNDPQLVKRVYAVAGEKICITDHRMIVRASCSRAALMGAGANDSKVNPPELLDETCDRVTDGQDELTVPKGRVFVLGDNANVSYDSRYAYCSGEDPFIPVDSIKMVESGVIPLGTMTTRIMGVFE